MGVVKYPEKENHVAPIWAVTPEGLISSTIVSALL
jgi:hypothetical protein